MYVILLMNFEMHKKNHSQEKEYLQRKFTPIILSKFICKSCIQQNSNDHISITYQKS